MKIDRIRLIITFLIHILSYYNVIFGQIWTQYTSQGHILYKDTSCILFLSCACSKYHFEPNLDISVRNSFLVKYGSSLWHIWMCHKVSDLRVRVTRPPGSHSAKLRPHSWSAHCPESNNIRFNNIKLSTHRLTTTTTT